jgi:hypothetical protein
MAWSAALSLIVGILTFVAKEKFAELARISILLNKTREEVARDNVTKAEVERITSHIDQRFNRLEEKISWLRLHIRHRLLRKQECPYQWARTL